jgi:integrase
MARKAKELGALAVSRLQDPGMYAVGGVAGLYLQVLPAGGRSWVLRATVGAKRRDMGLGGFPDVTLSGARDAARRARDKIDNGIDPIEDRKALKSALRAQPKVVTFKEAAKAYIAAHEATWKNSAHRKQWPSTLETYVYPVIGDLSVRDIAQHHVLEILEPIWNEKTETAKRVRGRIETVLDAAKARKQREGDNPAQWRGSLDKLLPAPSRIAPTKHHPALAVAELPAFMQDLRSRDGMAAKALEFAILTAVRSGEATGATWSEIDLTEKTWTIPASRMKSPRDHVVPLSSAAVSLLKGLPRLAGNDLVFPAPKGGEFSDAALGAVIDRMNGVQEATWVDEKDGRAVVPHGFRSTFRDWAGELTSYPRDLCEMALAHAIKDKTEAAYRRLSMIEKRRPMMEDWAKHGFERVAGDNVRDLRPRRRSAK